MKRIIEFLSQPFSSSTNAQRASVGSRGINDKEMEPQTTSSNPSLPDPDKQNGEKGEGNDNNSSGN
ncbi:MAG: hypothetical protein AAF399_03205 [Bacteroidota bacterium]